MTTATPDSDPTQSGDDREAATTERDSAVPFLTPLIERVRQPEYVGENRCRACTVVNVGLALLLGSGASYGIQLLTENLVVSTAGGGVFLLVAFLSIALRGYLVPYTPTLTKRYLPDRVLRWFEHHDQEGQHESLDDIDPERELRSLGAIGECATHDDLCLTPSFEEAWRERMRQFRELDGDSRQEAIADLLELDEEHTVEEMGNAAAIVLVDGAQVAQWESDAAFVADMAADDLLRERTDRWSTFSIPMRGQLLNSLRMFVERCPLCENPVSIGQDTVESCCRSMDVVAVTCTDCDARIFEVEVTQELQEQL